MKNELYSKFKIIVIFGICASIVSILVNWPNSGSVVITEIFIITGIAPLAILINYLSKRYRDTNKQYNFTFVFVSWLNLIIGTTLLLVAVSPQLSSKSLQVPGNLVAGLIFIAGAVIGFSNSKALKIDMIP